MLSSSFLILSCWLSPDTANFSVLHACTQTWPWLQAHPTYSHKNTRLHTLTLIHAHTDQPHLSTMTTARVCCPANHHLSLPPLSPSLPHSVEVSVSVYLTGKKRKNTSSNMYRNVLVELCCEGRRERGQEQDGDRVSGEVFLFLSSGMVMLPEVIC